MAKIHYNLEIYTFDIDFNSHVSNIVYIKWMEIGRLKLLETVGLPVSQIMKHGFAPVLIETSISYQKPLFLHDSPRAEIWVSELGKASAWLDFRFLNQQGEIAATGRQRGLFVNYSTGKPRKITQEERSLFEPYVHSDVNQKAPAPRK